METLLGLWGLVREALLLPMPMPARRVAAEGAPEARVAPSPTRSSAPWQLLRRAGRGPAALACSAPELWWCWWWPWWPWCPWGRRSCGVRAAMKTTVSAADLAAAAGSSSLAGAVGAAAGEGRALALPAGASDVATVTAGSETDRRRGSRCSEDGAVPPRPADG